MLIYLWNREAGTSGATGTLASTLGALALVATAVVPIHGATASTLDGATLSASGRVQARGSLSATLSGATISSSGTVPAKGTLAVSIGSLTLTGTGHVPAPASVGTASITLAGATLSASGTVTTAAPSQVQALLDTSRIHHVKAIQFKRARNIPAYLAALAKARDIRAQALALDPDRSEQAWINEGSLVPKGQNAHDELTAFYQRVLG